MRAMYTAPLLAASNFCSAALPRIMENAVTAKQAMGKVLSIMIRAKTLCLRDADRIIRTCIW
jgi:hypothetical protein